MSDATPITAHDVPPWVRPAAAGLGLAGAAWGALVGGHGLGIAAAALPGAALALRHPGVALTILFGACVTGAVAIGTAWIGPGALLLVATLLALWAVPSPFAGEVARERAGARGAETHGRR